MKLPVVLAYGGGVNSTAIIGLAARQKLPLKIDVVLMALTGSEELGTDEEMGTEEYVEKVIKPYLWMEGIKFVTVKAENKKALMQHYYDHKIIPTRMYRHCTDNYKIKPMRKWCNRQFPDGYVMILGIDAGESQRAKTADYFPLIDMGIDRDGCKREIELAGMPIPIKSGCRCCPYKSAKDYKKMSRKEPEAFKEVVALEKNNMRYPEMIISTKPLEVLTHTEEGNSKLCDYMQKCAYCE
jgi:hypothetical protein